MSAFQTRSLILLFGPFLIALLSYIDISTSTTNKNPPCVTLVGYKATMYFVI
ncbi:putative holin-like toxin [Lactiplantibacillus pentosus]